MQVAEETSVLALPLLRALGGGSPRVAARVC